MTLDILQAEMIIAMKNKDKIAKDALSSAIAAIKNAAIEKKCKENITEELVNEVLLKEMKVVQEMIDTCPGDREDLLKEYQTRLEIIKFYAPKLVTDKEEIRVMIYALLSKAGIDEPKNLSKGMVMKAVMPDMKGKADMKLVQEVLNEVIK